MNSLEDIKRMKEENLRCYYIDSDGDEVIVSDEEDYDVAIDYVKSKGEGKVTFVPTKRQNDDSEEELDPEEVKEPRLTGNDSLKHVADTVSVEGNDEFESSDESDDGIEEIDASQNLQQNEDKDSALNYRLNGNVQDTVSRDSSLYLTNEEAESIKNSEKAIKDVGSSVDESQIKNDKEEPIEEEQKLEKQESADEDTKRFMSEFSIIQSKVQDYQPNAQQTEENRSSLQNHYDMGLNSDQIKNEEIINDQKAASEPAESQNESKVSRDSKAESDNKVQQEEEELSELNKSVAPSAKVVSGQNSIQKEDQEEEEKKEVVQEDEFEDKQRVDIAMSMAKATKVEDENKKKVNLLHRALENVNFIFGSPEKKFQIAQVDNTDEEKSQDYVVTCKPGKTTKKRWRIVNNSSICWPNKTKIKCQNDDVKVDIPKITTSLRPGEKMDVSINITINENEKENKVEVYVFRFWNKLYGFFGEPMFATVEITPEESQHPAENLSPEEKLQELLEGDDVNPILYEIANDFVEEGLGTFQQCLDALLQCKSNYADAKDALVKLRADNIQGKED